MKKIIYTALSLAVVLSCLVFASTQAQNVADTRFLFPDDERAAMMQDVPSPKEFLGYDPGEQFTPYHRVDAYIHAVAAASDRVSIHEYGQTYEGRGLYYLVVTSPENHSRIDDIKRVNLELTSGRLARDRVEQIIDSGQPVLTWLSYNVHGNEPSSTEAAMHVLFRLAARTDASTQSLLAESVVIIDPTINPDGRDRYVNWYRSVQSNVLNVNTADYEHTEPWPGGRTNHYWFDLNRDWVWLVHSESRGRLTAYQQWMPQVHIDYHEQGFNNNYFTMPGQTPRNLNLPEDYETWSEVFGRASAATLDESQVNYFTRESFDFFYPGYGSSYPSNLGAIGMLAEQGGGSRGAEAVETNDGYVLTLKQRVHDHYATSLAVIQTAAVNRAGLLRYFADFFRPDRRETHTQAYLLRNDHGNGYAYDVINLLLKHGIKVERAIESFSISKAFNYEDGASGRQQFDSGTFIVRTEQPRHVLINTLLQRQMTIEDSVMYDMATWSAPLAYGLDAAWTESEISVDTEHVATAVSYDSGAPVDAAKYAYVIDWAQRNAPAALAALWKRGYRVRYTTKTFTIDGRIFSRGTLVVLLGRNRDHPQFHADMKRIAAEKQVRMYGFDSGRVDSGIDLASASTLPISEPRVGLVVGKGVNSYTAGQIWFLFDRWTGMGIDRLELSLFPRVDLTDYDVLVFPGATLDSSLDSLQVERLSAWVSAGGTLIATESSAIFFTESLNELTSVDLVSIQDTTAGDSDDIPSRFFTPYEARSDSSGLKRIPGSALRTVVDHTHPLAFGLGKHLYTLKFGTDALKPSESLQTVARYYPESDKLLVSGYASNENRDKLAGNTFAGVIEMGEGRVVLLLDNTQYRMFWVGPARMMQNAVMLVPGM